MKGVEQDFRLLTEGLKGLFECFCRVLFLLIENLTTDVVLLGILSYGFLFGEHLDS